MGPVTGLVFLIADVFWLMRMAYLNISIKFQIWIIFYAQTALFSRYERFYISVSICIFMAVTSLPYPLYSLNLCYGKFRSYR